MDAFYAFCLWTFLIGAGGSAAGHYLTASKLTGSCDTKGEMVVGDTVFTCKITHKIINNRRVALEDTK